MSRAGIRFLFGRWKSAALLSVPERSYRDGLFSLFQRERRVELESGCIPCPREKGEESGNREGLYIFPVSERKESRTKEGSVFPLPGRKKRVN